MLQIALPTSRQRKQIGTARLRLIEGTPLACADGYKLLADAKAVEQLQLIERFMYSAVDMGLEVQRKRISERSTRQTSTAARIKREITDAEAALDDILSEGGPRLAALCCKLTRKLSPRSSMALAAAAFREFSAVVETAVISDFAKEMAAEMHAVAQTPWEQQALSRRAFGFRNSRIDAPTSLNADECLGLF